MSNLIEKLNISDDQYNFYLLVILVIASLIGLAIIVYKVVRLQILSNDFKKHNLQLKILLNNQPDLWVSWLGKEKKLLCSAGMLRKLGVDNRAVISPHYIKYLFDNFDYAAFFESTRKAELYKQECITVDGEVFYTYGKAKRLNDDWCYTIWFKDISHQKSKAELHNDIINELRIERDIMKDMLDNVPWPIWYKNHQKKLLFCNKAYGDALEISPDQAVVEQIFLKSWQQGGRTPNLTDLVLKTKHLQSQKSHVVMKNERHYVEFTETITQKGFVLGYLKNLSDQEKLQEEINHLAKSMHEILEVVSLPVIIYNNKKQVEFFNNPFLKMFELDALWLETKPTFSEVLEELRAKRKLPDTEDFQEYKNRRLACFNNLMGPIEDIAYYPDGRTVRMVTAPYHNGGLMITLNDITDWLTLERRYNTLLAVHRQVADNLFEGLAVFGTDNRLQLYNSAFCRMWHYQPEDLVPAPHLDNVIDKIKAHIDHQHYDVDWDNFKKRIRAKIIDRSNNKEGRIKLYDEVVYDYSSTPLPDGSCLLTFLDVSDRYRIEKNLLERSEALELAHGIKSDFIAIIHQGIKYPLRRILLGFMDILEQKYGEINLRYQERLKNTWQEVDQVLRFVEDANDLVSIDSGGSGLRREKVDMLDLIQDINATLMDRALEKNIQISVQHNKENIVLLNADLRRLKQVFFNLLRNAILYASIGEFIGINITDSEKEIQIAISNIAAIIPYEDTYGASKKLKKGEQFITGLGFSLIKKIVTLHGGRVTLNHQKGTVVNCVFSKEHN
jgi:PAS domain-containing protein/two-component sensor histidine kinase